MSKHIKFEYKMESSISIEDMNKLGEEGWELIYIKFEDYFYFKRKYQDD